MTRPTRLLDPVKVRSARLAQGYPERALSGMLGVSNRVIDRLEAGHDQANLDLRFVRDLASALGRDISELLAADVPEALEDPDAVDAGDVARIGAVLAADGGHVQIDVATQALRWTRARTLVALHSLDEGLRPVGQRLAWLGDHSVVLTAGPVDDAVSTTVQRRDVSLFGLDVAESRLLHQLLATGVPARIGDWDRHVRR